MVIAMTFIQDNLELAFFLAILSTKPLNVWLFFAKKFDIQKSMFVPALVS